VDHGRPQRVDLISSLSHEAALRGEGRDMRSPDEWSRREAVMRIAKLESQFGGAAAQRRKTSASMFASPNP
jgi:hypothetical protein